MTVFNKIYLSDNFFIHDNESEKLLLSLAEDDQDLILYISSIFIPLFEIITSTENENETIEFEKIQEEMKLKYKLDYTEIELKEMLWYLESNILEIRGIGEREELPELSEEVSQKYSKFVYTQNIKEIIPEYELYAYATCGFCPPPCGS